MSPFRSVPTLPLMSAQQPGLPSGAGATGGDAPKAELLPLDLERQKRARELASRSRWLFLAYLALSGAVVAVFSFAGLSTALRDALPFHWVFQLALLFLILLASYSLVLFPLSTYWGFTLPRRYGLLTQHYPGWLLDWAKGTVLSVVLLGGPALAVYSFLRLVPDVWWLVSAASVALFTALIYHLTPVLIIPLFFKQSPLGDQEMARRVTALAEKVGQRVRGVFTINMSSKGTTSNAFLMGLGRTRRVVLTDTMLASYPADEVEVILAHELGHHAHRDLGLGIVYQSLATLAGFYAADLLLRASADGVGLRNLADPAGLPVLALSIGTVSYVLMPLGNALSRWQERRADIFALKATNNSRAFANSMTRLTNQNLSEADPPGWARVLLHTHPSYRERVSLANQHEGQGSRQ